MPRPKQQPLQIVASLLDANRPVTPGLYALYFFEKKICLLKNSCVPASYPRIAILGGVDINEGLTPLRWSQIDAKIRQLIKEGKL